MLTSILLPEAFKLIAGTFLRLAEKLSVRLSEYPLYILAVFVWIEIRLAVLIFKAYKFLTAFVCYLNETLLRMQ